jgi:hypothetical protein
MVMDRTGGPEAPCGKVANVRFVPKADIRPIRSIALTYRQVELVEKGNFKGQIVERAVKFLAMLNDLMANYQTLRRRISPLAE